MLGFHSRTPKILSTILLSLFMSASICIEVTAGTKTIRVNFEKSDIVFSKQGGYDILSLNTPGGFQDTTKIGEPRLPVKTIRVLIPEQAKVKSVRVVSKNESPIEGTYTLQPLQKTFFTGEEEEGKVVVQKQAIYTSNTNYPRSAVELISEGYFREYQIISIVVYPIQYRPLGKALILNREVIVEIEYQEGVKQSPLKQLRQDVRKQKELREKTGKLIYNPEDIGMYYGDIEGLSKSLPSQKAVTQPLSISSFPSATEGRNVDYVIITSDELASSFQRLADWKTKKGVVTVVKTVSWISQNYSGCDPQQKIRHFIQDAYSQWNVDYILLGGDDDIIPLRINSTISEYAPVSDLYYSEMTSTDYDWNQNGDDKFGDYLVYYDADIWVGRAPVHNTAEVDLFIDKVFTYERNSLAPSLPDPAYLKTFLSMAGLTDIAHGWNWDVGVCAKMKVDSAFIYPNPDLQIYKIYEDSDDLTRNPFHGINFPKSDYPYHLYDERLNKTSALQALNRGYGIVNYVEHSGWGAMAAGAKTYGGRLVLDDIDGLTNGNEYSVCFLVGCSPSALDYECFGERFLLCKTGGGVAVIGPSRTTGFFPGHQFDFYFFESLFAGKNYNIGKAFGLAWYSDYTASFFNLLGDPEMPVWTKIPDALTVTHPTFVQNSENDFSVTIGGLKNGEEAVICLKKGEEDYAVLPVTGTGSPVTANFIFTPDTPGEMTVTVTAHNYIPYEAVVPVTQTSTAHLYVENTTINDDESGESHGNGDGKIDAGETIELSLRLKNSGSIVASSVVATFEAYKRGTNDLHPDITIIDGSENYGNIVTGGSANCLDDYEFIVSSNCPDEEVVEFRLTISYDIGFLAKIPELHQIKTETFYLQVGSSKLKHTGHYFEEPLEAGSEIGLYIELSNYGSGVARGITATLSSTDPDVESIVNPTISVGDINPNSSNSSTGFFDIIISSDYPGMTEPLDFTFIMQDVYGHQWQQNFNLKRRPDPPTGLKHDGYATGFDLIWTPKTGSDFMGYNVYRSNTLSGPYQKINNRLIDSVSYYKEVGLPKETVYYYRVTAVDTSLNESDMTAPLEAWTNIEYLDGWPIKLHRAVIASPMLIDIDGNGTKEIFTADEVGRVYAFTHTGAELFDIDGDPNTVSGFANIPGEEFWSTPAITDFDGDGKYELVISGRVYPYLYCWRIDDGNGDGKPDLLWKVSLNGPSLGSPVIGNIDNIGMEEIVTLTEDGNLHVLNSSDGSDYSSTPWPNVHLNVGDYCTPALADLDRDGDLEIIVGGSKGIIYVLHHNGDVEWQFNTQRDNLGSSPAVADIDLDGSPEIIYVAVDWIGTKNDVIYVFDSNGQFKPRWENGKEISAIVSVVPPSPGIGNLDGDDQLEIVVASGSKVYVWNHDGSLLSGWPQEGFKGSTSSPIIADIDGVPGQEIIFGAADKRVYAWHGDGSKVKYWPARTLEGVPSSIAVADINGDGRSETITSADDRTMYVWDTKGRGEGDWPMFRGNLKHTGVYSATLTVQTDLDGTANKGIVKVNGLDKTSPYTVDATQASYDLSVPATQTVNNLTWIFNRWSDGVTTRARRERVSSQTTYTAQYTLQAIFTTKIDFNTGASPRSVTSGDLNGDGRQDLAVANGPSSYVCVFINTSTAGSLTPTFLRTDIPITGIYRYPSSVAIGDLNGDQKPDLAVTNEASDKVSVFFNTTITNSPTPSFTPQVNFPTGEAPVNVSIGDLNSDGKPDLAVANDNGGSVSVLLNMTAQGALVPSFTQKTDFISGYNTQAVAIGDLNNDGKPDIATANNDPFRVSVFLNTTAPGATTPTFMPRKDYISAEDPFSVTMKDMNSDGKLDLVVANLSWESEYGEGSVSVLLNTTPPGTTNLNFLTSSFGTGFHPYSAAAVDLNGDTKPDLAVTNSGENSISVLFNTTEPYSWNPSFSTKMDFSVGSYPWSITSTDLNGDYTSDIVVTNFYSNTISVLMNLPQTMTSGNISTDTEWRGDIFVTDDITIYNNATLTIYPGSNIYIGKDCKITEMSGSKILANGTLTGNIKFRKFDAYAWDKIRLNGNNNQFAWCVFDGGNTNVDIRSIGNTFNNCRLSHGGQGISANYANGTSSTFTLNNCIVENNTGDGIYLYGSNPTINQSTIQNNSNAGIYLLSSNVHVFTNNVVKNNGSYGIYLNPGTSFYMGNGWGWHQLKSPETNPPDGAGKDSIAYNGMCEIYQEYCSFLCAGQFWATASPPVLKDGYNKIMSNGLYICNVAYTFENEYGVQYFYSEAYANKIRWDDANQADPEKFSGPVDYNYPLTFSPVTGAGAGNGTVPILKISNPQSNGKPTTVLTASVVGKLTEQTVETAQQQFIVDLKNKMLERRGKNTDVDNNYYCAKLLGIQKMLRELDPTDMTKELGTVNSLLSEYRARMLSNKMTDQRERLCGEAVLVNEVQRELQNHKIIRAQELIKEYTPYLQNKDNKRAMLFAELVVNERLGNYVKAWDCLQKVKSIEPDADRKKVVVAPSYKSLEAMLIEKAGEVGIALNDGPMKDVQQMPRTIMLFQNYPNPFNPTTTIKYEIPATGQVTLKVYDMLGRIVAVLEDGMKEAGYYTNTFNASRLASGVYFSRLTVKPMEGNAVVLVKKMLLVK